MLLIPLLKWGKTKTLTVTGISKFLTITVKNGEKLSYLKRLFCNSNVKTYF